MKFKVNDQCIGCGSCEYHCPKVFQVIDDTYAVAIEGEVPEDCIDDALIAVENCPASAIEIIED